jgi:hypothetical protein
MTPDLRVTTISHNESLDSLANRACEPKWHNRERVSEELIERWRTFSTPEIVQEVERLLTTPRVNCDLILWRLGRDASIDEPQAAVNAALVPLRSLQRILKKLNPFDSEKIRDVCSALIHGVLSEIYRESLLEARLLEVVARTDETNPLERAERPYTKDTLRHMAQYAATVSLIWRARKSEELAFLDEISQGALLRNLAAELSNTPPLQQRGPPYTSRWDQLGSMEVNRQQECYGICSALMLIAACVTSNGGDSKAALKQVQRELEIVTEQIR